MNHYRHLLAMAALSFGAMYVLMYAMVNAIDDVYMNVNQVYMAGLMSARDIRRCREYANGSRGHGGA